VSLESIECYSNRLVTTGNETKLGLILFYNCAVYVAYQLFILFLAFLQRKTLLNDVAVSLGL